MELQHRLWNRVLKPYTNSQISKGLDSSVRAYPDAAPSPGQFAMLCRTHLAHQPMPPRLLPAPKADATKQQMEIKKMRDMLRNK